MELTAAIVLGLLSGALLGTLGAGGSVLTVPILVYVLDMPLAAATTASLAVVAAAAALGTVENARHQRVEIRLGLVLGATGVLGALVGTYLHHLAPEGLILVLLALLMLAAAASLLVPRPERDRQAPDRRLWIGLIPALGLGVGVLTGFFGVGGGFLIVPALVLVLGLPMHRAIGTSLLVIAIAASAGLVGHLSSGSIPIALTVVFGLAGLLGVWAGTRASALASSAQLARGFALMLAIVAVFLIVENGPTVWL